MNRYDNDTRDLMPLVFVGVALFLGVLAIISNKLGLDFRTGLRIFSGYFGCFVCSGLAVYFHRPVLYSPTAWSLFLFVLWINTIPALKYWASGSYVYWGDPPWWSELYFMIIVSLALLGLPFAIRKIFFPNHCY